MIKNKNLKLVLTLSLMVFVLMAYITLSAFVGGNLNVQGINLTQNMLQTRIVQSKLSNLGLYDGKIDGIFDNETILALKSYQEKNGLEVRLIASREISVEPDQNIKERFIREICEN